MALPHVVSVCAGAAALVLFAHVVVFVLRRRAQLDGEPDSPAVTAFGLAVGGLALATVVVSLAGASRFDEVLLLTADHDLLERVLCVQKSRGTMDVIQTALADRTS